MRPRTRLEAALLVIASCLVLALLVEEVPRILFPWDLRVYSESPFLTTMLKLSAGQSPYTARGDANSYIYSPGLAYLTFALLKPLGAQLDVRACRAVTALIGIGSAVAAGTVVERFWRLLDRATGTYHVQGFVRAGRRRRAGEELNDSTPSRAVRVLASLVAVLLVFTNYTADACHPDNLYALHAMLLIAMTAAAVEEGSYRKALVAVAIASAGILVKQTAVFGFVSTTALVLWFCARRWGAARSALLVLGGLGALSLASWIVLRGWGHYWAFELISNEPVQWFRFHELVAQLTGSPHRLFIAVACAPCALYLGFQKDARLHRLVAVWAAIGVTEVLPSLGAYLKIWGSWNNLVIIESWMALPVLAVAIHFAGLGRQATEDVGSRAIATGALLGLLASLVPTRSLPTEGQFVFGRALDEAVAHDVAAGKRVLLSHGTSTLIHNGVTAIPLDRSVSTLELVSAGDGDLAETRARFATRAYDKVYLLTPPYPQDVQATIDANYHQTGEIAGDGAPIQDELSFGVQSFMHWPVRVMEANLP